MKESTKKITDWVHRIILPCAEVTRILSESPVRPLSVRKRIKLRVHLVVCAWCARYKRQLAHLRIALHSHSTEAESPVTPGLSQEARDRIRRSLGGKQR